MSHNRSTNGSKNKRKKVIFLEHHFFNNRNTKCQEDFYPCKMLASKFPSIYFIGTNALSKQFVLFTEESWSISSLMS